MVVHASQKGMEEKKRQHKTSRRQPDVSCAQFHVKLNKNTWGWGVGWGLGVVPMSSPRPRPGRAGAANECIVTKTAAFW